MIRASFFKHQRPPTPGPPVYPVTRQDIAIVVCGGGDPFAEFEQARAMCERVGKSYTTFVGNDMIADFPGRIDHAGSLHPDKLSFWFAQRLHNGFEMPERIWAHRPFSSVTNWTRDWGGSTGLFLVKVARESGFTHIVLCGVPMRVEAQHYLRKTDWIHCHGFLRGWTGRLLEIKGYVRSFSGWTAEQFTLPTEEWMLADIPDEHLNKLAPGARA
jgi:hypothetical protein